MFADATTYVPDLAGLSVAVARERAAEAQVVLVGPDPDQRLAPFATVTAQRPHPGAEVQAWSSVMVWTRGDGDAGVREPRDPDPPLRELIREIDPDMGFTEESGFAEGPVLTEERIFD